MKLRRIPLILSLVVVFAIASLGWLVPLSRDSQAAPAPLSDAAFKGKVLLVVMDWGMIFLVLERAQVQKIGDHSFLVGQCKEDGLGKEDGLVGCLAKNRSIRLQLEHISYIIEFDDLKDAKKALESAIPRAAGPLVPLHHGKAAPMKVSRLPLPKKEYLRKSSTPKE